MEIRKVGNFILDTLFPIECLGCGKEGQWLCHSCGAQIPLKQEPACFVCKRSSTSWRTCFVCQRQCSLAGVVGFFEYSQALVREVLRVAKYGFVQDALQALLSVVAAHVPDALEAFNLDPRAALFVPVPLHPRRFRERGFNQAEMIAQCFAEAVGARTRRALTRVSLRPPQASLDAFDRARNIKGVFTCANPEEIRSRFVFVVDDVATTGATLDECGRALRAAGAAEVWSIVLARG